VTEFENFEATVGDRVVAVPLDADELRIIIDDADDEAGFIGSVLEANRD